MTITNIILRRIRAKKRGWVFGPKDFLDITSRSAVDNILSRFARKQLIRRIGKGIYDFPKVFPNIGMVSPNADKIASAIARKIGTQIFPSGAMAANLLGLSTQVPAKSTYLTNGATKYKKIGNRTITLKHAHVPLIDNISFKANLALQALSYMGKNNIDAQLIQICAAKLSHRDRRTLNKIATALVPAWMVKVIHQLQHVVDNG